MICINIYIYIYIAFTIWYTLIVITNDIGHNCCSEYQKDIKEKLFLFIHNIVFQENMFEFMAVARLSDKNIVSYLQINHYVISVQTFEVVDDILVSKFITFLSFSNKPSL